MGNASNASANTGKKIRLHLQNGELLRNTLESLFGPRPAKFDSMHDFSETTFFPGHLGILRSKDGFTASLKGGHNNEMHNHNDLGHFTLFYAGTPVIIDLGTNVYSAKTFSSERYHSIYHGAHGHNAAIFDGICQEAGRHFTASLDFRQNADGTRILTSDLHQAYPEKLHLTSYIRTLELSPGGKSCTLTDQYTAETSPQALVCLFTPLPVRLLGKMLLFNEHTESQVELDASVFDSIELIPLIHNDGNIRASWGDQITQIRLSLHGKNTYTLKFTRTVSALDHSQSL